MQDLYNTDFSCTYYTIKNEIISNEMYQTELLKALKYETYDDDMPNKIDLIISHLDKYKPELLLKLQHTWYPSLLTLFSYDYFYLTHSFLCNFIQQKNVDDSYAKLLNNIKIPATSIL